MIIKVEIKGIAPLLMNRFHEENEVQVSSGISSVTVGERGTPREQAKKKAYMDKKGYLYLPGPNLFAALISAGKFHKMGKSKVTTITTSLVPAGLHVHETVIPLTDSKGKQLKQFEVDSRAVVIPATKGRVMMHRPRLDKWYATFHLEIDEQIFKEDFVRILVDDAGKKIGVCDYRPERKGPFGRFVVRSWEVLENEKDFLQEDDD